MNDTTGTRLKQKPYEGILNNNFLSSEGKKRVWLQMLHSQNVLLWLRDFRRNCSDKRDYGVFQIPLRKQKQYLKKIAEKQADYEHFLLWESLET